jgi:hypothetical protein
VGSSLVLLVDCCTLRTFIRGTVYVGFARGAVDGAMNMNGMTMVGCEVRGNDSGLGL